MAHFWMLGQGPVTILPLLAGYAMLFASFLEVDRVIATPSPIVVGVVALRRPQPPTKLTRSVERVIGDYQLDRFVAAGGMGNVYVGRKLGAGGFVKKVAIKRLLPELAVQPALVDRFLKEARLVARLSHPNIVQALDLGQTDDGHFIVMEYIDGVDAATLISRLKREQRRIPVPVAAQLATSICLALDHVHRACDEDGSPLQLIHHDVSPHNIMIDLDGHAKLADFGVAQMRHDAAPTRQLVGKAGYVAPEQITGRPYDHRIDVFATGVVLYELLTLHHPFACGTEDATLRATEYGRYLSPERLRDDCPSELVRVIERALAPVEQRFDSAAELAEALQRASPLDSRNARELGRLVCDVKAADPTHPLTMLTMVSLPTISARRRARSSRSPPSRTCRSRSGSATRRPGVRGS